MKEKVNMRDNPKIAICIPSYNHAKYLPSLFQSICDQTYQNLEIFFSDDGSSDRTRDVVQEWYKRLSENRTVKFTFNMFNYGDNSWTNIKSLMNSVSDADLIQFCESDDYFKPDKFEKQVKFLLDNPDFGAVHTDVEANYEDGSVCEAFWKKYRSTQTGGDPTIPVGNIRKYLEHCNFIYTCSMLVKTELYKQHYNHDKFKDELQTGFGDYPFFLALSKETKIGYIDEPLSVYRVLTDSLSHSNRPWIIEKTEHIKSLARKGLI